MFTHTSPTVSLQGLTARLSQIRIAGSSSPPKKKAPRINHTMSPARQVQRELMAQQTAKSQQAGPRRPHYHPHLYQDAVRARADRARPLPETPREPYYSDGKSSDAGLIRALSRKPVPRRPLRDLNPNLCDSRAPDPPQRGPTRRASSAATSQALSRMSDMYTMIDDHLAWNMSSSDLEDARPGSSGTMFLDFDTNGDMEVSYRNGVNKKLPSPPVPAKPTRSRHAVLRGEVKREVLPRKQTKRMCEVEKRKLLPPQPSYSSRHDSVISSGRQEDEKIDRYFDARPLPRVPPKDPRRTQAKEREHRRSHPPQVHQTQSTREQASTSPSPTPSHHTAPVPLRKPPSSSPSGQQTRRHTPSPHTSDTRYNPTYTSGHDPATNYTYTYSSNNRRMQIPNYPPPSRPQSHASSDSASSASSHQPYVDTDASRCLVEKSLPELPCADMKKRRGVRRLVKRVLGGWGEVESGCRWPREDGGMTWVERGYVT